jgi:hypothetical protein
MKTAVEWLVEQLQLNNYISENAHWLIDEAKELEKQQIIESINNSFMNSGLIERRNKNKKNFSIGEQYYKETFKK